MKQYVYFYLMKQGRDEKIKQLVPHHEDYWEDLNLPGYEGAPFADATGGMIIFDALDEEYAEDVIKNDPFNKQQIVERWYLKEWAI